MTSLQDVFEETLFLLADRPTSNVELSIVLIHSINQKEGMKINGLMEDDPSTQFTGLAEGWQNPINGVYSLRYQNLDGENIQFKIIPQAELQINAVRLNDGTQLFSCKLNYEAFDFNDNSKLFKSNQISQYKKEILLPLLKKKQQVQPQQQQPRQEPQQQPQGMFWQQPRNNPFAQPQVPFGRSDLDPFSGAPGFVRGPQFGSQMGPEFFNQGQFRPGNVPPGARYDPLSPNPNLFPEFPDLPRPPGRNQFGPNNFPF